MRIILLLSPELNESSENLNQTNSRIPINTNSSSKYYSRSKPKSACS